MIHDSGLRGQRVFVTGHTGFKGSWLCLLLRRLGAEVYGYALPPPSTPNLFTVADIATQIQQSTIADIRDAAAVTAAMQACQPDVVIHMAAQPLVRDSYRVPVDTYAINVMGTVHLLDAVRQTPSVRAVVNVTTDKVYQNNEWQWGYRETDRLGGCDPYSNSKACSELVSASYRHSYFHPARYAEHRVAVATARAGNVIGGGDWATDRLIPDCVRALMAGEPVILRNPNATRPWQHVLEPLHGYIRLAEKLLSDGPATGEAYNFGPLEQDHCTVASVVERVCQQWGTPEAFRVVPDVQLHEAGQLRLDPSLAMATLGWRPRWSAAQAIDRTVAWYRAFQQRQDIQQLCAQQIAEYQS